MKKITAFILALLMAMLTVSAFAAGNASPSGDDYNKATTNYTGKSWIFDFSDKEELIAWANAEVAKLAEAESIQAYFGLGDAITAILGEGEYAVNELQPVYAAGYEESMGPQEIKLEFATPYKKGTNVAVMLGFKVGEDENGEPKMAWNAYAGKVLDGSVIAFNLDPATILRVQENYALLAVINK